MRKKKPFNLRFVPVLLPSKKIVAYQNIKNYALFKWVFLITINWI